MTNYTKFPIWRSHDGFTIKYNEHKYSWSDDRVSQREYLATSTYLDKAEKVFVGRLDIWMDVQEFRSLCNDSNYEKALEKTKEKVKLKKNGCPICGGDLKLIYGRKGPFYGCVNYPKCRYTENS